MRSLLLRTREPQAARRDLIGRPAHAHWVYSAHLMAARSVPLLGRFPRSTLTFVTKAAKDLLSNALDLDITDRAELAAQLIASLDGEHDEDVEAAWAVEIERRMTEIDGGTVRTVPWADAKARIEAEMLKK